MDIILLCKILAALEWHGLQCQSESIITYIYHRYQEIFSEVQNEFNHLYLEL